MTQHTPGPWTFRVPPEPVPHVAYWIDGPPDAPGATIGGPIADIKTHARGATEADARLIAAAPDLLAALNSLTQIGTTPDGGIVIGPRGWDIVQEAIAKARA